MERKVWSNKEKNYTVVDRLIIASILFIIILFTVKCISTALTNRFSFDGAMNVQVAQNLSKSHSYATSYNGLHWFDQRVQTGITVTLPVAIFFSLFGESFESGLFINAIYMVLLILAIIYYLKMCLGVSNLFILLAVIVIYGAPEIFKLGFGLIGELPALFFFFLSLICLHKFYKSSKKILLLFSGLAIGLGFLTKTVILISIPAFLLVAVLDNIQFTPQKIKALVTNIGLFGLGLLAPVTVFELYKFRKLGQESYLLWWQNELGSIFKQAGVAEGFKDTAGIFPKFLRHLEILSTSIFVHQIIIFILFLLLLIFTCIMLWNTYIRRKDSSKSGWEENLFPKDFLVLVIVALSYLVWWLFITPTEKAWYRRVFDGLILFEVGLLISIHFSNKYFQINKRLSTKLSSINSEILYPSIAIILLTATLFSTKFVDGLDISFTNLESKTRLLEVGDFIKKLPQESEYFGIGWWQSPNIAFISGENLKDISQTKEMHISGPLHEKYLLVDLHIQELDPRSYESVLDLYDYQLVFSNGDNLVYKLNYRK